MVTFFSILAALVILGIMIFVHELGHYLAGKRCGIAVVEFAIGFGPKILKWERGGTKYSLRLLPVGGYCAFLGSDDFGKEDVNNPDPRAMNNQPVWKRLVTLLAGPVFNIVFAFILAATFLTAYGEIGTEVTKLSEVSNAREAGIQEGDKIIAVNDHHVVFLDEIRMEVLNQPLDKPLLITVERGGQKFDFNVFKTEDNLIGVEVGRMKFGFFEALGYSVRWIYMIIRFTLVFIFGLFAGTQSAANMGGMVAIGDTLTQAVQAGLGSVLYISALISVSLGLFNLFPLPALDGGRIVFLAIEGIRRKPVPREKEAMVHFIGLIALLCLMVYVTYNDIVRLVGRLTGQ